MLKMFKTLNAAIAYDSVCNEGKTFKSQNLNFMGNMQTVAARYAEIMQMVHPDVPEEKLQTHMLDVGKKLGDEARAALKKQGCQSKLGQDAAKVFTVYTQSAPWQIFGLIDKELEKTGLPIRPQSKSTPKAEVTPQEKH